MKKEKKRKSESTSKESGNRVIEGEVSEYLEKYLSGLYNKHYINLTSII